VSSSDIKAGEARVRAWLEVREQLERQLRPLGEAAIAALQPVEGHRILDIGCGIGGTPAALARAVGATGQVVGIDVLQPALSVMSHDEGLPGNITFLCDDAQAHRFEPGFFDLAFSRFGVMFFADPVAAFRNVRRAMKAGGRLGFVCWRGFDENELDYLPLGSASPHLPSDLVRAAPSSAPFSFARDETIREVLTEAGFVDVQTAPHDERVGSGDLQSMVDVCSRVGALGAILRTRPDLRPKAISELERALLELDGPDGPMLMAAVWVVTARAPP
jgi:SAM-dependent methyltransferase